MPTDWQPAPVPYEVIKSGLKIEVRGRYIPDDWSGPPGHTLWNFSVEEWREVQ
jgi:hypothetical protein